MHDFTDHVSPNPNQATELDLFATAGDGLKPEHFGIDDHGRAFVEAPAFGRALSYSSTQKALQQVDPDEKGQLPRLTPGGQQLVSVIYEDGIWELIFRSTLPSAKAIKARVKAILRQLRETGVVDTRPGATEVPNDYETALVHLLDKVRENKALAVRAERAERVAAELAPAASAWETFRATGATLTVGSAAKYLVQRHGVQTGRNRLYDTLRELGWVFQRSREPSGQAVESGLVELEAGGTYTVAGSGQQRDAGAKTRLTAKGLERLAGHFGVTLDLEALGAVITAEHTQIEGAA